MKKTKILTLFFGSLILIFSLLTLYSGEMPWEMVWDQAKERLNSPSSTWNPLLDERLPRLLVLLFAGASLAVSGTVMQALFQNPLAAPSLLGVTAGGSLLATVGFVMGWNMHYFFALPLTTVAGCLFTLLLVYFLSKRKGYSGLTHHLILIGIAVATVLIALENSILYSLRDQWVLVQMLTEWQAGSTNDRNWQHVHMQLPLTIMGLIGCWHYRKEMNLLSLGEEEAHNLGVEIETVRWHLFICVSLLTGASLAAVGNIAFLGLVLPHLIRLLVGPNTIQLIPLSMLGGAAVLLALDQTLRLLGFYSLSIGNLFAFIGGIFFLLLLLRDTRQEIVC